MAQLICEGPCNPMRPHLDEAVRVSILNGSREDTRRRPGKRDEGIYHPADVALAKELRTLRHTPHQPACETAPSGKVILKPGQWTCARCGTTRAW